MCCCLVVSSESVQQWRWIAKCVLSLTECCDCYTGHHVLLSGCKLWVDAAVKVEMCTVFNRVLWLLYRAPCVAVWLQALSWYSREGECWIYASHVIIGMFLLFLQAPKWKQVARRSQDRLDNFVTIPRQTGELCASFISLCTLYIQDYGLTWRLEVHVRYLLCYCSKSISLLYRTTGDLKWLCVHVRYLLYYCSKSISLLYRTTGDLKWLCSCSVCAVLLQ